ncbi:DUF2293 domain-containing protein [Marinilabilia sp.]|uniref:DUF2293 domain-containing protein n=1 Tax=Marinilabilia sp. TaxID=2021252 RepID=UPI0025C67788|nr:DUF2293 domain-containing protein [Marinilabilia sp.]
MTQKNIHIFSPGPHNTLVNQYGEIVPPPPGWEFLPAGDAGVTRKVTSKNNFWRVEKKKGRRTISLGIWAPAETIKKAKEEMSATRETETYKKRQEYAAQRRDKKQVKYKEEFLEAVEVFLNFHPIHTNIQKRIAVAVTEHAIPIGSGTVARTSMIPLEERAARAVIAWMRHRTTAYDNLPIRRIKGERRRVRRILAGQSVTVLQKYREGKPLEENCPLRQALKQNKRD